MRILIAGPPKTGNMWLKCLLAEIYGLSWLKNNAIPDRPEPELFSAWIEAGGFPDGTIFHQHYWYSDELAEAAERVSAHLVSIVRDPYDAFVSTYFAMQQHASEGNTKQRKHVDTLGFDLHSEEVLRALREGIYLGNMRKAAGWLHSGRAHVLRYEDLHADPVATLTTLTAELERAGREQIEAAVAHCSADAMRQRGGKEAKHVRTATVGDSQGHLTEAHLAIFREDEYAALVRSLGYDVR